MGSITATAKLSPELQLENLLLEGGGSDSEIPKLSFIKSDATRYLFITTDQKIKEVVKEWVIKLPMSYLRVHGFRSTWISVASLKDEQARITNLKSKLFEACRSPLEIYDPQLQELQSYCTQDAAYVETDKNGRKQFILFRECLAEFARNKKKYSTHFSPILEDQPPMSPANLEKAQTIVQQLSPSIHSSSIEGNLSDLQQFLIDKTISLAEKELNLSFSEPFQLRLAEDCLDEIFRTALNFFSNHLSYFMAENWPPNSQVAIFFSRLEMFKDFVKKNNLENEEQIFEWIYQSDESSVLAFNTLAPIPKNQTVRALNLMDEFILTKENFSSKSYLQCFTSFLTMNPQSLIELEEFLSFVNEHPIAEIEEESLLSLLSLNLPGSTYTTYMPTFTEMKKTLEPTLSFGVFFPNFFPLITQNRFPNIVTQLSSFQMLFKFAKDPTLKSSEKIGILKRSCFLELFTSFLTGKITSLHFNMIEALELKRKASYTPKQLLSIFSHDIYCSPAKLTTININNALSIPFQDDDPVGEALFRFSIVQLNANEAMIAHLNEIIKLINRILGTPLSKKEGLSLFNFPPTEESALALPEKLNELYECKKTIIQEHIEKLFIPQPLITRIKSLLNSVENLLTSEIPQNNKEKEDHQKKTKVIINQLTFAIMPNPLSSIKGLEKLFLLKIDSNDLLTFIDQEHHNSIRPFVFENIYCIPKWNISSSNANEALSLHRRNGSSSSSSSSSSWAKNFLKKPYIHKKLVFEMHIVDRRTYQTNTLQIPIDISFVKLQRAPTFFVLLSHFVSVLGKEEPPALTATSASTEKPWEPYIAQSPDLCSAVVQWEKEKPKMKTTLLDATVYPELMNFVTQLKVIFRKNVFNLQESDYDKLISDLSKFGPFHADVLEGLITTAAKGNLYLMKNEELSLLPFQIDQQWSSCFSATELPESSISSIWDQLKKQKAPKKFIQESFSVDVIPFSTTQCGIQKISISHLFNAKTKSLTIFYTEKPGTIEDYYSVELNYGDRFEESEFSSFYKFHILLVKMDYYQKSLEASEKDASSSKSVSYNGPRVLTKYLLPPKNNNEPLTPMSPYYEYELNPDRIDGRLSHENSQVF